MVDVAAPRPRRARPPADLLPRPEELSPSRRHLSSQPAGEAQGTQTAHRQARSCSPSFPQQFQSVRITTFPLKNTCVRIPPSPRNTNPQKLTRGGKIH